MSEYAKATARAYKSASSDHATKRPSKYLQMLFLERNFKSRTVGSLDGPTLSMYAKPPGPSDASCKKLTVRCLQTTTAIKIRMAVRKDCHTKISRRSRHPRTQTRSPTRSPRKVTEWSSRSESSLEKRSTSRGLCWLNFCGIVRNVARV